MGLSLSKKYSCGRENLWSANPQLWFPLQYFAAARGLEQIETIHRCMHTMYIYIYVCVYVCVSMYVYICILYIYKHMLKRL